MKICLLGGKGYIGSYLNRNNNYDVYDKDNLSIFFNNISNYNVIIHLADKRIYPYTDEDIDEFISLNTKISDNKLPNSGIIYMSSCSIYGIGENKTEDSNIFLTSNYAKSKINSENIFSKTGNYTILRLGTVFGSSPTFRTDTLLNMLVDNVIRRNTLDIFSPFDLRPFLYLKDLEQILFSLIENKIGINRTINLVSFNSNKYSLVGDLLNYIEEIDVSFNNKPSNETSNAVIRNYSVNNQLGILLGLNYKYSKEEALKDFINELSKK